MIKSTLKTLAAITALGFIGMLTVSCAKEEPETPAEKIEEAGDKIGDAVEEIGDDIKDATN